MISIFQAIILGGLQGVSELFPISSLGHSVLLPAILGWRIEQNANYFLMFIVATHFATALTLFLYYWADWKRIIAGIFRSLKEREIRADDLSAKLGWLLIVATVPVGIAGLLFEKTFKAFFEAPVYVAAFLALNGIMLLAAEALRKRAKAPAGAGNADERIGSELSWGKAVKVGLMQVIALLPGFSRTGSTISGGLLVGLSHEDALRFSFLLATPVIAAAALLELPGLAFSGQGYAILTALIGAVCAALGAWLSARFLTRYFKTNKLTPFAVYCVLAGLICLAVFTL
ncbi:undecaprenyl-diphosphate phosphatase [Patescibacteria group bacterium]|nr:undecaprenyl-diphosphate phosphatase [Patescibacteria group bacterium]